MMPQCRLLAVAIFLSLFTFSTHAQQEHSVAREWNEVLLGCIRNDFARPTVHARNLFHTSILMYDAWAVYQAPEAMLFLGQSFSGFEVPFDSIIPNVDVQTARETTISFASYRLLKHRFTSSPGVEESFALIDSTFARMGHDPNFTSTDYSEGSAAALGNYLAEQMIAFGMQDNANEQEDYANTFYRPWNPPLAPTIPGNRLFFNQNRWQPLTFDIFIDQSGNPIPGGAPEFLSPEWGRVTPFALQEEDLTIYERQGANFWVYHDPGDPCYIDVVNGGDLTEEYKWGFELVSKWGSHLDPADGVLWDISPASIGNIPWEDYPTSIEAYRDFYPEEGGDPSRGHTINPHTGEPYEPQWIPRGDYARVLAEFWADGPDSETPPGHWFTILNYVNDHPDFEKRFKGEGDVLNDLEWDVKAYLLMGGAMHDCAISTWGVKGWYDYPRPISTIRWMGTRGQASDTSLMSYHINGLNLEEGFVELVTEGDTLAGENNENIGKIKLYTWRGPDFIESPDTSVAGVGWILAENWWPYQRPTFVTPPFAGYVSGHSTFSRAAAEIMTELTGDEFFPGGMGTFEVEKNEFLVFEDGPSTDFTLQWATYRDASDQTSLSRIWGGIHPPIDDLPGRVIGGKVATDAFAMAESLFETADSIISNVAYVDETLFSLSNNPVQRGEQIQVQLAQQLADIQLVLYTINGELLQQQTFGTGEQLSWAINQPAGVYVLQMVSAGKSFSQKLVVME
ncbi:MAG: T9SS type A sorting domain-containing protein [Bacteroidota bacterium]